MAEVQKMNEIHDSLLLTMLNVEASNLAVISDACGHIQTVTREVAIQKIAAAAQLGDMTAIDVLVEQIERAGSRNERYLLCIALKSLGSAAAKNESACAALMNLAKHSNFEIRLGTLQGFKVQLRSSNIIAALQDLQHGGKISAFLPYQKLIAETHEKLEDEHHLVRSCAIDTLTDLVENLYSESIMSVSKRLSDSEEFVRKLAADVLAKSLLNCRVLRKSNAKNVFVQEGFAKLLNAVVYCFRSGQALENGDEYMRRTAVNVLAIIIDDLDAKDDRFQNDHWDFQDPNSYEIKIETTRRYGRKDVMDILADSVHDQSSEIRQVATSKILALAEAGDAIALQAFLLHIDTCFELGFGSRNLGLTFGQVERSSLVNKLHGQWEQEADSQANSEEGIPAQEEREIREGKAFIDRLVQQGFVSKIRDIAFSLTQDESSDQAAAAQLETSKHEVSVYAAQTLVKLSEGGDENAGIMIVENLETFFALTGLESLDRRSAERLESIREQDTRLSAPRSPNLVKLVEALLQLGEGDVPTEESVRAAVELFRLAEGGDWMAGVAITQHVMVFLSAVGRAGIFKGKIRSTSEALRGFLK